MNAALKSMNKSYRRQTLRVAYQYDSILTGMYWYRDITVEHAVKKKLFGLILLYKIRPLRLVTGVYYLVRGC